MGDLLVAEHAFAGMEGAQDVEPAGQRGDELAVLAGAALGETVLGELCRAAVRVTRWLTLPMGVFSCNGRLFLCETKRAIALPLPQCANEGFDLRTCKAAMSQMRDSPSRVVKCH